jgi:hypothetical protein
MGKRSGDPCRNWTRLRVTYWISFQLAIIAHPLSVICCDIAPEAKIIYLI